MAIKFKRYWNLVAAMLTPILTVVALVIVNRRIDSWTLDLVIGVVGLIVASIALNWSNGIGNMLVVPIVGTLMFMAPLLPLSRALKFIDIGIFTDDFVATLCVDSVVPRLIPVAILAVGIMLAITEAASIYWMLDTAKAYRRMRE